MANTFLQRSASLTIIILLEMIDTTPFKNKNNNKNNMGPSMLWTVRMVSQSAGHGH